MRLLPSLEGLNLKPLSMHALALTTKVVADLGHCIHDAGFATGRPQVRNLGRGRVHLAKRLSKIIADDRRIRGNV